MSSSSSSSTSSTSSSALSERAPLLPKTPDSSGSGTQGKEGEGGEAAAAAAAGPTRTVGAIKLMMMFPETRWRCFLGLGISILTGSMFPAMSIIFGSLFNSFYTMGYDEINESIDFWAIAFACLAVTAFLMMFTQVSTFGTISEIVSNNLRVQLFNSILDKDVAFFDRHTSGDLTSRLQTDMTAIQAGVSEKVGTLSQNLAQFVLGITVALFYGWQMTLVLLSVVPLLIIAMAIVHTNMQKSQRGASDDFAAANTVATETLAAFRTVLSFGRSDYERERYRDALEITLQGGLRRGILNGLGLGITFFLIFGTYALGFWYGGKLVSEGTMDPGDELTVFFSVVMGAMGLGQGASQMTDIIKAGVSAGVVFDLIEEPELIIKNLDTRPFTQLQGRLDVNNVSFRYPARPDNPVLNGVSFTVYPGQTVALVGSSGSGKSSILQLLLRFYDPSEGSIAIDGHDIRNVNLHSYRENIGLVSQEPILFSGTIMENIRYGSLNASDNDIFQAAMQANAHNFITSLPEGYNTAVGEKGTQLSGGQKQRVAIARAILKNPSILLLDEATSALDAESERLVQDALNKLMVNRTTIIVAHRLSTIQNADRICYLSGGQILESGTHQELLDLKGGYYQLIRRQTWTAEEFSEAVHDEDVPAP